VNVYVLDTHGLLLWVFQEWAFTRLGQAIMDLAGQYMAEIIIPAMALAEALPYVAKYSHRRQTIPGFIDDVEARDYFRVEPMGLQHVRLLPQLGGIRELHDRMIAAHAVALGAPLMTPDEDIRASGAVECVW